MVHKCLILLVSLQIILHHCVVVDLIHLVDWHHGITVEQIDEVLESGKPNCDRERTLVLSPGCSYYCVKVCSIKTGLKSKYNIKYLYI
jgi:hypothetical protein